MMNIGLNAIEMSKIRRVSKTTNRLVPIFEDREYDDYELPRRQLPPIDNRMKTIQPAISCLWWNVGTIN